MKLVLIFASLLVLANALTFLPITQRFRRDVSELGNQYLAPTKVDFQLNQESATETFSNPQQSQDFAEVSYQNKTGSDLNLRQRQNVSHLEMAYLPPEVPKAKQYSASLNQILPPVEVPEIIELLTTPSPNEYLPPVDVLNEAKIEIETPQPFKEYLPAAYELEESEVKTEPFPLSKEYLAFVSEIKETDTVTEQPKKYFEEYLPPSTDTNELEDFLEVPFEPLPKTNENPVDQPTFNETSSEVVEAPSEGSHETVLLEADGYHYKIPENLPNLFLSINPPTEYLPPLEEGVVEAEGPSNGETATLEEDGYHYRAIKRLL